MTISPKLIAALAMALVIGATATAPAQTRQPRAVAAKKFTSSKSSRGLSEVRAKAAPLRGPSEGEIRWMERASAPSNAGGGGGDGGGAGGGGM